MDTLAEEGVEAIRGAQRAKQERAERRGARETEWGGEEGEDMGGKRPPRTHEVRPPPPHPPPPPPRQSTP